MSLSETIGYYLFIFVLVIVGGVCESCYNSYMYEPWELKDQPNYIGADGHDITLIDNPNATDPTYGQLFLFIDMDKTDEKEYIHGVYTCGDYAEDVHNNAEALGIKAGWVAIDFEGHAVGHAINVFNTTDKGLVYFDCTECDIEVAPECGEEYTNSFIDVGKHIFEPMGIVSNIEIYW